MAKHTTPQNYPRISKGTKLDGYLDDSKLVGHQRTIPPEELLKIIEQAVEYANKKSSRAILEISDSASEQEVKQRYMKEGKELFKYFRKYCGDPASTAYECFDRHYAEVAREQFHNRTLQKERMNSGWRYQKIAYQCAGATSRFSAVSDMGTIEADFNVTIETVDYSPAPMINIYVSVKNRTNTMGGQDWPKAIYALEDAAKNDKNRAVPYLCVFGIAMERGDRSVKRQSKSKMAYSNNTEVWLSDYFWRFFSNLTYESIMLAVSDFFAEQGLTIENRSIGVEVSSDLIESFGNECFRLGLVDASGKFNDRRKLVSFFCSKDVALPKKNMKAIQS